MSIFGKGHYEKIPVLKGEDMPSNIYKVRNVLNKTYFESLFYNVTSELTMMIGEILGVDVATQLKMTDNINVFDMIDSGHDNLETGLYIATQNFSLYIKPGKDMYLIPFNLTNIAMETMQKPEFEAVYYCKFDETPLPVVPMRAYNFASVAKFINDWFGVSNTQLFTSFGQNYGGGSTSIFRYILKDIQNNDSSTFVHIPKVRINKWKIPIFTDTHANTVSLIRDLEVQIDFMALPYNNKNKLSKNFESSHIKHVSFNEGVQESEKVDIVPGDDFITAPSESGETNIMNSQNGNFIELREIDQVFDGYASYKRGKSKYYTHNKRPNRHCRYLVSAFGYFDKPNFIGVEHITPAQYLRVHKVYDSEGELPMSSGFSDMSFYPSSEGIAKSMQIAKMSYEGVSPDPEDLTNPMDIALDFEFVQCKVDNNFEPIDTIKIGSKKKTLLGYLVLKAYSGYVGSTLHDGVYDFIGVNAQNFDRTTNERYTSYDCRTRPHDTFFKVTLRTSKYQKSASGNFTKIARRNEDDEVDDIPSRGVWSLLKNNIKRDNIIIDSAEAVKRRQLDISIRPDVYNESPIYFAPTLNTFDKSSMFKEFEKTEGGIYPKFMTSYEKSPDFLWGEYDFYKYRIEDKGGYLRPPIQDTVFFLREYWKTTEWLRKWSNNYISGPINWNTFTLDKYHYDADKRIRDMLGNANVGGVNLNIARK